MKTRVIAISNMKGGCSKTTTCVSIGSILSQKGYRVLLIDLDAQANLTCSLLKEDEYEDTIYTSFVKQTPLPVVQINENLHVVPSSIELACIDLEIGSQLARERFLTNLIAPIRDNYDFILCDCPPSLGLPTLNAFTACTDIVVPLVAEVLPFEGLKLVDWAINMVKRTVNPDVKLLGVLITQSVNTRLCRTMEKNIRASLGQMVFKTNIRNHTTVAEAPAAHLDIVSYDNKSRGACDYMAVTEELLTRINL